MIPPNAEDSGVGLVQAWEMHLSLLSLVYSVRVELLQVADGLGDSKYI